jgi:hypothetical protein
MLFTTHNFPALKRLTIDMGSVSDIPPRPLVSCLTSTGTVANVEHLIIKQEHEHNVHRPWRILTQDNEPLKHFMPALQNLILVNIYAGKWNSFLRHLKAFGRLQRLEVLVEDQVWDDGSQ